MSNFATPTAAPNTGLIGLPKLMTLAFTGGDINAVGEQLLKRIQANPEDAEALVDMAIIFIMRGDTRLAASMQNLAWQTRQIFSFPRPALPVKIRALAILGPGDLMANSPFEFLLQHEPVALDLVYITPQLGLPARLPEHDVLLVAMAESDVNAPLLAALEQTLHDWPCPVINRPARIASLSRDLSCATLSQLSDVLMPPTLRLERALLEACCRAPELASAVVDVLGGVDYPFIIRPVDSHAGLGLQKIDSLPELTNYLINSPEPLFFVSKFIDYRSPDGLYRKYRLILIDGQPHVCHMAISRRWMVHYLNADMLDDADHRAEEAQFMESFDHDFGQRHRAALAGIATLLGLDYVGLDCAETADGRLLIFEVDSNMVVHDMDAAELFPYKKIQMPKLFRAFTEMLASRCGISL